MDEHGDFDDAAGASQNVETESASGAGDGVTDEQSGPLARVRAIGVEAVGAVVDAVLDAL
ncbi:hypothetical protein [Halorubrum saccharovorum]|uniref:hypothetical protein n=1 Tax=Halorubrum saccharovorum TaxID=2248 RepID=UPI000677D8DF|nr:hypothetical protein [Halorubrum saccharovorum]